MKDVELLRQPDRFVLKINKASINISITFQDVKIDRRKYTYIMCNDDESDIKLISSNILVIQDNNVNIGLHYNVARQIRARLDHLQETYKRYKTKQK